jgi:uridine kinase
MEEAKLIGICGGSGSGKTTIVNEIAEHISDFVVIPQDSYYRSAEHMSNQNITAFNFDHPDAFDNDLLYSHLKALKQHKPIDMPEYDFVKHRRKAGSTRIEPKKLIIFDGIMTFFRQEMRDLMDLKIYVDTPDDIRFIRRLRRDIQERGRTVDSVITQYLEAVRPGHFEFVEPTKAYADIIIPEGGRNENALQVLVSFVKDIVG